MHRFKVTATDIYGNLFTDTVYAVDADHAWEMVARNPLTAAVEKVDRSVEYTKI